MAALALMLAAAVPADAAASFHEDLAETVRDGQRLMASSWDYRAETRFVDTLDRLADAFEQRITRARVSADDAATFVDLLERTHRRYAGVLERMQAEVIRADGDLEAVQDSPAWRQRELLAMRVLYRLNWARYQVATSVERSAKTRKELLTRALSGFSEFVGADQAVLRVEALFGHGLSAKTLKKYDAAIADFRAALAEKPDSEMATGLRIALTESYLATGAVSAAVAESARLTKSAGQADRLAWFVRAKTLIVALGQAYARDDRNASAALIAAAGPAIGRLCGFGGSWRKKAEQLIDAGLDRPQAIAGPAIGACTRLLVAETLRKRAECDAAEEIYDALWRDEANRAEVAFGRGSCRFDDGDHEGAYSDLRFFLDHGPSDDPRRAEALYLAFKSAEAAYIDAAEPSAGAESQRYLAALEEFLGGAAEHPRAYEGWYRLGEWRRDHREFVSCHEAFSRLTQPAGLAFEAHFLGAQCLVEEASKPGGDDATAAQRTAAAVAALDAVVGEYRRMTGGREADRPPATLAAKAALMAATLSRRTGGGGPEKVLERLAEFDGLAAARPVLLAKGIIVRIGALRQLKRWQEAALQVERLLALPAEAGITVETLKTLALALLRDAEDLDREANGKGAATVRRAARSVYLHLLAQVKAGRIELDPAARDAISRLIDRLDESGAPR